jgi:hypothetical protein
MGPIKIHGYPYDPTVTEYADPSKWPTISAQAHWRPGNSNPDPTDVPQMHSPSLAHTHLDITAPVYGEMTESFTVPFSNTLFQVEGAITDYVPLRGPLISNVVFDKPLPLVGDPNGVVTITGHFTVDFSLSWNDGVSGHTVPKKGWFAVQAITRTYFKNGDFTDDILILPFFSMVDPMAPEEFLAQGGPYIGTNNNPNSLLDMPEGKLGGTATQYDYIIPILSPLTQAVPGTTPKLFGYIVDPDLPDGVGMTRYDMDLHHDSEGILINEGTAPANRTLILPSPFDPAILGPGTHKVAAIWQQDSNGGRPGIQANEQATSLLVVTVQVGGVIPPPPEWHTLSGTFQQLGTLNQYRLCADMNCTSSTSYVKTS